MTVELRTSEAKAIYMVTDISVGETFNIPFKYLNFDENIKVAVRTQANEEGNDDLNHLTLDTDYYITSSDGTNGVWGVVTFQKGYSGLQSLVIYRDIPITQDKVFNSQTIFSDTTESALDKLTMIAQDKSWENRILRAPIDDIVSENDLVLDLAKPGYLYTDENGAIKTGNLDTALKSLRQPEVEASNDTFIIDESERRGKILAFGGTESADVEFIPRYTAGENITISEDGVISAVDTTYTAGENITISEDGVISAVDTTYTAGENITISEDNVISAIDTTYTAGENITISEDNVISATDTTYTAGKNITISEDNVISAVGTKYTAGEGISPEDIRDDVISVNLKIVDPTTWAASTLPFPVYWQSVCYGNGKFIAVDDDYSRVAYSKDGISWTAVTLPFVMMFQSVCYGNGKFVAVASNSDKAAYSEDGITWTEITMQSAAYWRSVCYGNGKFVAVASSIKAAYSKDGITWTGTTLLSDAQWCSVCYGNGKFVAIAQYSSKAAYSEDGITWTAATLPSSEYWRSVCYGNGKFVAVAYDSAEAAYSYDGITWTRATMPSSAAWQLVCYGNWRFVAVAYQSTKAAYTV